MIKVQADALEGAYLLFWAKALGVEDLLRRAFDEAGRSLGDAGPRGIPFELAPRTPLVQCGP